MIEVGITVGILALACVIWYVRFRDNAFALADAVESKRSRQFWMVAAALITLITVFLAMMFRHRLIWPIY